MAVDRSPGSCSRTLRPPGHAGVGTATPLARSAVPQPVPAIDGAARVSSWLPPSLLARPGIQRPVIAAARNTASAARPMTAKVAPSPFGMTNASTSSERLANPSAAQVDGVMTFRHPGSLASRVARRRGGAGLGFPQGPADPGSPKRSAHEVRHRAQPELVRGLRKLQLEPEGMRRGRALAFARARCECYVGIVLISSICKFALTAFRSPGTRAILPMRKPLALTGFMETMLISHASRRAHTGHCNPNSGTGRSMACRPVGLCPPERFDRGWTANRGPRCTRVSAMRVVGFGGASRVRSLRTSRPARHVSARREIG
jgi:hypothetical protein